MLILVASTFDIALGFNIRAFQRDIVLGFDASDSCQPKCWNHGRWCPWYRWFLFSPRTTWRSASASAARTPPIPRPWQYAICRVSTDATRVKLGAGFAAGVGPGESVPRFRFRCALRFSSLPAKTNTSLTRPDWRCHATFRSEPCNTILTRHRSSRLALPPTLMPLKPCFCLQSSSVVDFWVPYTAAAHTFAPAVRVVVLVSTVSCFETILMPSLASTGSNCPWYRYYCLPPNDRLSYRP